MIRALLFIFLSTTSQITFGQKFPSKIDSLNSKKGVEKLIRSLTKDYPKYTLKPITAYQSCKKIADSLHITKSFYKADFDNNGYTDLLAIGEYYDFSIFVVMNYGNDSLKLNKLTRRAFQDCTFPKVINDSIIRYYYIEKPKWREQAKSSTLQYRDLIFKFGDFIEYNPQTISYSIEKIEYQTTMCYGSCPVFYISIDKDESSVFKAERFNQKSETSKEINGTYHTILKTSSFLEIANLLDYIDFPNLKDKYSVNWTDDQTCTLTITYNNGQIKTIRDYGLLGTYGLNRLYQLLFGLRFNQDWK